MAWVRWRGKSAQLVATVWEHGRSRQHVLANFHGAYSLSWSLRESVERNFPALSIDWMAVADALAQGPPEALPLSMAAWDWARVEYHLQVWAHQPWGDTHERASLRAAAAVLSSWRSRQPPLDHENSKPE
ncbi:MAG: hypothetical protein C7B46_14955 [Sulfobacillus benefaciens]|jgi:hypothetical protein|uniref:Uncharacterized protein n=1 Tax=Sulfobacillus benefaciens TaxID=453960 RepID=A0A2T2XCT2_9FIRM|nr:MAG: hypothetical protein C7B46_14955 [Sulfobacillus benefaciens]